MASQPISAASKILVYSDFVELNDKSSRDIYQGATIGDILSLAGPHSPGTVTSVTATAGAGISLTGDTSITSSGTFEIINTDPGSAQNFYSSIGTDSGTIFADQNEDQFRIYSDFGISTRTRGVREVVIENIDPGSTQNIFKRIFTDSGNFVASGNDDNLAIAGGDGTSTSKGADLPGGGSTVVIDNTDKGSSQNIFKLVFTDTHGITASSNNSELKILGGDGTFTTVTNGNEVKINNTDKGSSQNIFKNIQAQNGSISAANNNDTARIIGRANEVEVLRTAADTLQVSLPDSVIVQQIQTTSGTSLRNTYMLGNTSVNFGNLTVTGNTQAAKFFSTTYEANLWISNNTQSSFYNFGTNARGGTFVLTVDKGTLYPEVSIWEFAISQGVLYIRRETGYTSGYNLVVPTFGSSIEVYNNSGGFTAWTYTITITNLS